MFSLRSLTMKILIFVTCMGYLILPVQPEDMDRYTYCESCLTTAREIEKAVKEAPAESRQTVIENLISGGVCEKLLSYKHDHVSKDKMTSSCIHLLDSRYDQFHAALVNKEPKHLDIVLCYEQSTACVGVKHQSFEDSKKNTFKESDIEALLRDNKENVRIAQPTHSGTKIPKITLMFGTSNTLTTLDSSFIPGGPRISTLDIRERSKMIYLSLTGEQKNAADCKLIY